MRAELTASASLLILFGLIGCSSESGTGPDPAGSGGSAVGPGSGGASASSGASGETSAVGSGSSTGSVAAGTGGTDGSSSTSTTSTGGQSSGPPPLVHDVEDTGEDCPEPPLPAFSELESISHLPDPFEMASGDRISSVSDWRCRRAEIKAEIEKYGAGEKPGKPGTFEASLSGNTLSIKVGEGGSSFTITAPINRPAGAPNGPIPAIIGVNSPTGSLPAQVFSSRGIATITFNSDQLMSNGFSGGSRTDGNFYKLYPGTTAGSMIRWAWGISRIIDALEMLPEANIDTKHIAVSGCSFQGKIALYSGAFDERIALTIPHESGGGGTISWRYSDMLEKRDKTEVENLLHAQGAPWYAAALMQFNNAPDKLPYDHHELMAMVAPRALLAIESTAIARMGAEAARVDALAAREIWAALGVPFRLGASEENTNHCVWHNGFTPDLEAYVDRYLLGKEDVDTDILRSKYTIDTDTWIPWETPTLQ
ncbi:hypothetical protein WMF39_33325 [Sorangium sp. So ce1504]|uniref:glucuronyl esterase domain-containing protein n=1 Tax=Sorangium sp. So ce1504 TaxID=3133337 RepID=UPI003F643A2A